ncbi:MAG: anthranilate synthase component I, partial [Aestuariivirgaceae bacterium]|nr:anthranilate synthase component I [Aestuariivirgaceae bacterium]
MQNAPDIAEFTRVFEQGKAQTVSVRLVADLETPVSAMLKLARHEPMSFLLESVEGGAVRGRYSIIGMKPDIIWRTKDGHAEINRKALSAQDGPFTRLDAEPLASLRALLAERRIDLPESLPPMAAGVFGYIGYDMVRFMEKLPEPNPDMLGMPDSVLIRPTIMAIFDSVKDEVTLVTPVYPEQGTT